MMFAPLAQAVEVPTAVYVIWGVLLAVIFFGIIPLVWFLLYHTLRIARAIERNFADAAEAGVGVANNTASVDALKDTIQVATTILSVAGNINNHSETIKSTLAARAGRSITNGH